MKKKSSIIKLTLIGVALAIGIVLSVCSFRLPFSFYNYNSFASSIKLGLDLKGGIYAVYDAESAGVDNFDSKLAGTQKRLQDLLVSKGYSEAVVTIEGKSRLRVEVPDVDNPSAIFELIGKPAELQFVLDDTDEVVITGDDVTNAEGGYDSNAGSAVVSLELTSEGGKKFGSATSANIGKKMSIDLVTDGVREESPISTATIQDAITNGRAQITMSGQDTQAAKDLASQIMSGTFDVKLSLKESSTVSPTLGEKALFLGGGRLAARHTFPDTSLQNVRRSRDNRAAYIHRAYVILPRGISVGTTYASRYSGYYSQPWHGGRRQYRHLRTYTRRVSRR